MTTYTTYAAGRAYVETPEEGWRNGALEKEVTCVYDDSGKRELEMTLEEQEEFLDCDADTIPDIEFDSLLGRLRDEDLLEPEQSDREKPNADDSFVRGMAVVQKYGDRNAVLLGGTWFYVDEPAGTEGMFTAHKQDQFASLSSATDIMEELGIALGALELSEDDDDIPVIYEEARTRYVAMLDALETIAAGNSDPDDMVRLAVNALK
jgi:hypothetical protein